MDMQPRSQGFAATPATRVQVTCSAQDCGSLLEVDVPAGSTAQEVIVECGNCKRCAVC